MTVLQALDRYYDRMATRSEAEAPGYSREKIGFAIVLSADGDPIQELDLRERRRQAHGPAPARGAGGGKAHCRYPAQPVVGQDLLCARVEPPARDGAPLRSTLRSRRQTLQCSMARPTKG